MDERPRFFGVHPPQGLLDLSDEVRRVIEAMLRVRYHAPTPLHERIAFRVEPPERPSERRVVTRGELRAGGRVTARGEGTLVLPDAARATLKIADASLGVGEGTP